VLPSPHARGTGAVCRKRDARLRGGGLTPGIRAWPATSPARSAPRPRNGQAPPEETARWEQQRHQQSSQRICIEHAIAEPKQWRPLQRYLGRRDHFPQTVLAIAGLVSDRAATR
jgi:hypothetical protein